MTENSRIWIFLGALTLLIVGALIGYTMGGIELAIPIEITLLIAIWILHRTMLPPWMALVRIPLLSLNIFAILVTIIMNPFIGGIIQKIVVESSLSSLSVQWVSSPTLFLHQIILIVLVGLFILLFNSIWTRRKIIVEPPKIPYHVSKKTKTNFQRQDYAELQKRFCKYMVSELDRYDNELNWSDSEYTILQAEVEVERSIFGGMSRVEKDLIAAIRRDRKTRSFLVIGDPGAGKSVSLRRLARELYKETQFTGIVPVYVNLREWDGPSEPTDEDISKFILKYLKQMTGREGKKFLDQWYQPMLQHGKFFFILDSFDEMSPVLDCDDKSQKLKTISAAFDRFFNDTHYCRGVLASRPFRQPQGFRGRKLTIRPFTETQIRHAMKKWLQGSAIKAKESEQIIKTIFTQYPQLAPALRNPFSADLIAQYVMNNDGECPTTYFAIFENYIQERLKEYNDEIRNEDLTSEAIVTCATEIAWQMYQDSEIGLEADTFQLRPLLILDHPQFDKIIALMRAARLIRLGGTHNQRLSFVHRRFAEYFVVRALQEDETRLPSFETIPRDSRWRDCLVVYSGIATAEKATEIANFCWNIIHSDIDKFEQGQISEAQSVIHALRFLRDAFQGHLEYLKAFQDQMANLIKKFLKHNDILIAKLAAEMVGLLKEPSRSDAIVIALKREIPWLFQTTLRACRHLPSLDNKVVTWVRQHVKTMPILELFGQLRELSFSFGLSDSLQKQKWFLWFDVIWFIVFLTYLAFLVFIAMWYTLFSLYEWTLLLLISTIIYLFFSFLTLYTPDRPFDLRNGTEGLLRITVPCSLLVFFIVLFFIRGLSLFEDIKIIVSNKSEFVDVASIIIAFMIFLPPWEFLLNFVMIFKNDLKNLLKSLENVSLKILWQRFLKQMKQIRYAPNFILKLATLDFLLKLVTVFLILISIFLLASQEISWAVALLLIGLIVIGFIGFIGLISLLITFIIIVTVIYNFLKNIYNIIFFLQDNSLINKLDLTSTGTKTVTEKWVYETTNKLRTRWGCYIFLDRLIAAKLPLKDFNQEEKVDIPEELSNDIKIREKLAQLQEQWYGLNE